MEDEADETDELPVDPSEEAPPSEPDDRTSAPGGPPRWQMVLVGLLVGAVIGGGLAWWSNRDDDSGAASEQEALTGPDDLEESPEAAEAFVDAWERSRTETYLSGSLLRRTLSSAVALELPIVVAQRPPDRVVSTGSSVQADVGGENTVCDEQLDGIVHCQPGGPAADYDAQVQAELAVLRSYVDGDTPVYRVSVSEGCFDLRLVAAIHAPPYGHNARFCFDAVSGAPRLIRIERNEGTDEVTLVTVRTDVTDEDIARVAAGDVDEELLAG